MENYSYKKREFILNNQKKKLKSDEDILDSLSGALDRLQKAFPKYGSFIMEFIQNADDAQSKSEKIELDKESIRILNDGNTFSYDDVTSICKVGRSSKTPIESIGYLGVGFKSVFLISDEVEIYSNGFQFRFSKAESKDPFHIPWQIIPLWIEEPQIEIPKQFPTLFNLRLKDQQLLKKLTNDIKSEQLNERILLFLKNIQELELIDHNEGYKRTITKSQKKNTKNYEIIEIQETLNNEMMDNGLWVVFKSIIDVPSEIKNDRMTIEWERERVNKREIVVTFRLDENYELIIEEEGTAHIGVFSFLPLKEVPSGLNFLIQADFLTTPGRTELARECSWNEWLAEEIFQLIITKTIPVFLEDKKWKMNFTEIIFSSEGGHPLFEKLIKQPLREFLLENPVLVGMDGSLLKADEAIILTEEIRHLIDNSDLEEIFPGKKVIHDNCKYNPTLGYQITQEPRFNAKSGFINKMKELFNVKLRKKDVQFFIRFFKDNLLKSYPNSSPSTYNRLSSHDIILTEDFRLTNAPTVYFKSEDLKIPDEMKGNFQIVHQSLILDPDIKQFLKKLGIQELTSNHIQDILKTKKLPEISKTWNILSDKRKIHEISNFKDLWINGDINEKDLNFITLKSLNNEWLSPDQLLFPKEYRPSHNLQVLIEEKEVLKLQKFPLEFVNVDLIKEEDEETIDEWRTFLEKLGVDSILKQNQTDIVERIGILTALKYEKSKGRQNAEELGGSEKPGYDIISDDRYIEAKGRRNPKPELILSANEYRALLQFSKDYYVYIVRDALSFPILCVLKGDKIGNIVDKKVTIPFNKWYNETLEEEYQP